MNIRHALPDDVPAIARVHIASWQTAYRGILPEDKLNGLDYSRVTESFRKSILLGAEDIYVAEQSGHVVGFTALISCHDDPAEQKPIADICAIYLSPEYWRQGIGRMLYDQCENTLRSRCCMVVALWVFAENARARRFYETMGFTTNGEALVLNMGASVKAVHYRKDIGYARMAEQSGFLH